VKGEGQRRGDDATRSVLLRKKGDAIKWGQQKKMPVKLCHHGATTGRIFSPFWSRSEVGL
jgi:hypothetical protein